MQGDSTPRRSEGRFYIDSQATRVTLTSADGAAEMEPVRGRLSDLSLHGCKLAINGKIAPGTAVNLHIEIPSIRLVLDQPAIVRWQQPRDAVSWWTGCELTEPFRSELVDQLANAQVLNRRRDPRYPVGKVARARWELSDEIFQVELVNFSKGGFCIIFPNQPETLRERLLLLLDVEDHEVTVPARVMWSGPVGERFAVGCAFGAVEGFVEVRSFAEQSEGGEKRNWFPRIKRRAVAAKRLSTWIPITLLVLAALQGTYMLRRHPEWLPRAIDYWQSSTPKSEELLPVSTYRLPSDLQDTWESEKRVPVMDANERLLEDLQSAGSSQQHD